jgi:hypothetical protein
MAKPHHEAAAPSYIAAIVSFDITSKTELGQGLESKVANMVERSIELSRNRIQAQTKP